MRVHRTHGQHVVVIPGRTDHHRRVVPRCFGLLSRALAGFRGVPSGRDHHGVLDVDGVRECGAERAVVEPRIDRDAGNRGDVDHRSAQVGCCPDGLGHGVDVTES